MSCLLRRYARGRCCVATNAPRQDRESVVFEDAQTTLQDEASCSGAGGNVESRESDEDDHDR